MAGSVLLLSAEDVEAVLEPGALIAAVEDAFRRRGQGGGHQPGGVLGVEVAQGGFHVKVAALSPSEGVFAVKLNGNFPGNPASNGLPTIQGFVVVVDVSTGEPLAILESGVVTRLRTAAASAVAIRHLATAEADTLTIVGCGLQAFEHVRCADHVRSLRRVMAFDTRMGAAETLVDRIHAELGLAAVVGSDLVEACAHSQVIITCTTSRTPVLANAAVPAGALVVAVGADNPHKQELDPALLANALVVTDDTAQCAEIGDLHHAVEAGVMTREQVHAELGQIVAGVRRGRTDMDERMVFDSTGTPIQDAAACELALAMARARGVGSHFTFRE
jgi:alanine dehydrogenase